MKRLRVLPALMPNAVACDADQLSSADAMDAPTALRVQVRTDRVPDWFAVVGMLKEYGAHVKRYQFHGPIEWPAQTLCLEFEEGYRDRANYGHDSLYLASSDLRAGPRH